MCLGSLKFFKEIRQASYVWEKSQAGYEPSTKRQQRTTHRITEQQQAGELLSR